jgi:precorrin-6B methylase 2
MQGNMLQKNYYIIILLGVLVVAGIYFSMFCKKSNVQGDMPFEQATTLLKEIYQDKSGFGIPTEETDMIRAQGGAPTYGEISYQAVDTLLKDLFITDEDVLYDLGSGVGKVVLQGYLSFPFKKVVGVELSKKRFDQSVEAKNLLKEKGLINPKRPIVFVQEDFADSNLDDATVVYMGSTCYSSELMDTLVKKLAKLKKGLRVISLKSLPDSEKHNFALVKEYRLPMSWSKSSPVHVYELKEPMVNMQNQT